MPAQASPAHGVPRRALIVCPRARDGELLSAQLRDLGCEPMLALLGELDEARLPALPELVIVDPAAAPVGQTVARLRDRFPGVAVVVHPARPTGAGGFEAAIAGADGYVPRPATALQILTLLRGGQVAEPPEAAQSWDEAEREYIHWVVESLCGGNRSQAARHLGLHRSSLQRKLARMLRR